MAIEATTAMAELTTLEAAEDLFDFTAMWISMGVLGFFHFLLVVGYGLIVAQTGRLHLPQRLEDKEPLNPPHHDDDIEANTKKAPLSGKTDSSGNEETANAMVAEEAPPSYDQVANGAACKQEAATNTDDCDIDEELVDGGNDVSVEVYEQEVDITNENNESTYL